MCFDALRAAIATMLLAATPDLALALDPSRLPPVLGVTERVAVDPRSGLGLGGYDPVGYLLEGSARPGLDRHEALWGGVSWRFASAANRAAFLRAPDAFAPRLGGHDPAAAAASRTVSGDPTDFAVVDGATYLFRDAASRERFLREPGMRGAAESGWKRLEHGLVPG